MIQRYFGPARLLLVIGLIAISGATLAVTYHQFSLCTKGSGCQDCSERSVFTIEPDATNKSVALTGIAPDGIPLMTNSKDCEFKDGMNWVCRDGRLLMISESGKIHLTYVGPKISSKGREQEVCLK